jgi:molecular chaperone GrpE
MAAQPQAKEAEEPAISFVRAAPASPAETDQAAGAPAGPDELAALRAELDKVKAQAAEYLDGWQRARAELSNARRRFEKERSEAGQFANNLLLKKFLPALDDLDRALKTVPDDLGAHAWVNGVALIQRKFSNVLESENVKAIEVKPGDLFNPAWHEAVTHEEHPERKEGEIIAEVQKGYKQGDQVLRPALVRVAK